MKQFKNACLPGVNEKKTQKSPRISKLHNDVDLKLSELGGLTFGGHEQQV